MKRKKIRFRTTESSPRCRRCGFYYDLHKTFIENACNDWIPSDNLEYLQYKYEEKRTV